MKIMIFKVLMAGQLLSSCITPDSAPAPSVDEVVSENTSTKQTHRFTLIGNSPLYAIVTHKGDDQTDQLLVFSAVVTSRFGNLSDQLRLDKQRSLKSIVYFESKPFRIDSVAKRNHRRSVRGKLFRDGSESPFVDNVTLTFLQTIGRVPQFSDQDHSREATNARHKNPADKFFVFGSNEHLFAIDVAGRNHDIKKLLITDGLYGEQERIEAFSGALLEIQAGESSRTELPATLYLPSRKASVQTLWQEF